MGASHLIGQFNKILDFFFHICYKLEVFSKNTAATEEVTKRQLIRDPT